MVRECRPPEREPMTSWLARRSTMATSTPANANSPDNISPVGPPPAITTAWSVIATLRPGELPRWPPHGGDDGTVTRKRELPESLEANAGISVIVRRIGGLEIRREVFRIDQGEA